MFRASSLIASAAASLLMFGAAAAHAQPVSVFYSAKPVAASSATKLVVRDTVWKCGDSGCVSGSKGKSRAAFVCESLVKEIGQIESFRAGAEEFDADALAKCNAKA